MNKYYFIVPACLLAGFIFFYRGALDEMEIKANTEKARIAAVKAEEDAKRQEVEKRAQIDAEERQKAREKEEEAKRKKNEKSYNDAMAKLKKDSDGLDIENAKLTKEAADLEQAIINERALKDKTSREAFDLSKQVELEKINRRSAELEIQRLIEMLGTKAAASTLASMPPPPPVKK